jgi:hypothetical protein
LAERDVMHDDGPTTARRHVGRRRWLGAAVTATAGAVVALSARRTWAVVAADLRSVPVAPADAPDGAGWPPGWRPLALPGKAPPTRFAVERVDGRAVLRADADRSMSALAHPLAIDPGATPIVRWRWRVDAVVAGGRLGAKAGDDFAARVYLFFALDERTLPLAARMRLRFARGLYGDAVPAAALCYVWDGQAPAGSMASSPYTDRVQMVVATGRETAPGAGWVDVRRDCAQDFRDAFLQPAPAIDAIAVAADTDNTGGRTTAWFDGFTFAAD